MKSVPEPIAPRRAAKTSAFRRARGRNATLVLAGLAFLAIGFVRATSGINTLDEAYFLQVVHRVASGGDLYRDVWFPSTPLSVYLTLPLVAAFGVEVAWVKLLLAVTFAVSLIVAVRLTWKLGIARTFPVVVALAVLVWAVPYPSAFYQQLGGLFLLGCFLATVAWVKRDWTGAPRGLAVAAGSSAAFAFASKYTLGVVALTAALGSFAIADGPRRDRLRAAGIAMVSFLLVCAASLAPALTTARAFYDAAFASKGTYLAQADVSYLAGFHQVAPVVADSGVRLSTRILSVYWAAFYVVPVGALLANAWLVVHGESRREAGVVLLFTAAALATLYPLADYGHLTNVAPVSVVGAAYALNRLMRRLPARWLVVGRMGLAGALAVGACLALQPAERLLLGSNQISSLPRFRAAIVPDGASEMAARDGAAIARAARGHPMFLLMREAGFYYLVSGVRNPSRFDLPTAENIGLIGEKEVIHQIQGGRIRRVCVEPIQDWGYETPVQLFHFVRHHMRPGARLGVCNLYDGLRAERSA